MIKAILFDFDGTLVNSLPYFVKAYDRALSKFGFKLSAKKIAQMCFNKKEEVICRALGIPEKTEEFRKIYFDTVKELFKDVKLFEDSIETLDYLINKGIKIVIITFATRWYIDSMMKQFQLTSYIDFIISIDDVTHVKPHPEAVYKAVAKLKIKPEEALVVGDAKNDILMGAAAGSKMALFYRKEYDSFYYLDELKKANPTYIIDNLSKLKEIAL